MPENLKLHSTLAEIILEVEKELEESTTTGDIAGYETPNAFGAGRKKDKEKTKKTATQAGYTIAEEKLSVPIQKIRKEIVQEFNESVSESKKSASRKNRWLELKNDESMHANKKLAVGLKELKYQLREVEKFLGWYGKIKNINELDSDTYWKRTHNNIRKIKERIINIAHKLQELEK